MAVALTDLKTVRKFVEQLEEEGAEVKLDLEAGTVEALDDGIAVYKGIRKGAKGQPWIVRTQNSPRFTWN